MPRLLLLMFLLAGPSLANTCVLAATGNWSNAGTWTGCGGVAPTAADDVQLTGNYTVTLDCSWASPCSARSVDAVNTSPFTGTFTGGTNALNIGDAGKGAGDIALRLSSGMTVGTNSNFRINFVSTYTTTPQTIRMNGKSFPFFWFSSAGSWKHLDGANVPLYQINQGTVDFGSCGSGGFSHTLGQLIAVSTPTIRAFALNDCAFTITSNVNFQNAAGLSVTGTTAQWTLTNAASNNTLVTATYGVKLIFASTSAGAKSLFCAFGACTVNGITYNLSGISSPMLDSLALTGSSTPVWKLAAGTAFTVTGSTASQLPLIYSGQGVGKFTTVDLTNPGTSMSLTPVSFKDINFTTSGALDLTAGGTVLIGDCGGNSASGGALTTTTPISPIYWYTATAGSKNWSGANWFAGSGGTGGTARVPLCQDDVTFDSASIGAAGTTIMADAPRLGRNIAFTGVTNTPTLNINSLSNTVFGSLSASPVMTVTPGQTLVFESSARTGSLTWDPAGKNWGPVTIQPVGATLTLQNGFTTTNLTLNNGTFNDGGKAITMTSFSSNVSTTRSVARSGAWTVNGTSGTVWNLATTTGYTQTDTGSITISDTSAGAKTFAGGGLATTNKYGTVIFSGDNITISGANTFNALQANATGANGLKLTAGTTQTINGFSTTGTGGTHAKLLSTASSAATIAYGGAGTICMGYIDLTYINGSVANTWYSAGMLSNTANIGSSCPATGSIKHRMIFR